MKGQRPLAVPKVPEYLWRIADAYDRMACFPHAEAQLRELLELDLDREQRLEALCFLADIQVRGACHLRLLPGSCHSPEVHGLKEPPKRGSPALRRTILRPP